MRLFEFEKRILVEAEDDNDALTINVSLADIYDMTGQLYPQVRDPDTGAMIVPEEFFQRRTFEVGNDDGQISPALAQAHAQWVAGGRAPGLIYDPQSGEMREYNENPALLDFAFDVAAGTSELAGNLIRGGSAGIDTALQALNLSDTFGTTRATSGVANWFTDNADWLSNHTDLDWQDKGELMRNAIREPGDIIGLILGGDPLQAMSWSGFASMIATELPSEILDATLMATGTLAGTAAVAGLNSAEAMGSAVYEIDTAIRGLYDDGTLQETSQWEMAMRLADAQLTEDGNFSETRADDQEALALRIIQDNTLNATVLKTGVSGAILDTIADRLVYGRLSGSVMSNVMARTIVSPTVEGVDEATQQLLINAGLINEAGDPRSDWENVLNAAYQGAVIGGAAGVVATGVDAARGANQQRLAAQARLRQFFFGDDFNNVEAIIDVMGMDPSLLVNRVTDPETGRLNLSGLVNRNIPTSVDQLSGGQRRQLSRTGRARLEDGTEVTTGMIRRAARNEALMGLLDNAIYNRQKNQWEVTFGSEDDIREIGTLLNIDVDEDGNINAIMRNLEDVLNIDLRVEARSDLEAPSWQDLNAVQRAEYVNQGFVSSFDETTREGQRWTREDILRTTQRYEQMDSVPDYILNAAMPTDARPTADLTGEDPYEIAYFEQMVEMSSGAQQEQAQRDLERARQNLADDQAAWDSEYGQTHNSTGTPRITRPEDRLMQEPVLRPDDEDAVTPDEEPTDTVEPTDTDAVTPDEEPTDTAPEVMDDTPVQPTQPELGTDLARAHIVYNVTMRLANKGQDPLYVESMMNTLEQTYPGITQEILGEGGLEGYRENFEAVEEATRIRLEQNPPEMPQPVIRPPRGSEVEINGQQYRFLGRMWAPVNADGTLGSTGVIGQNGNPTTAELNTAWSTESGIPIDATIPPTPAEVQTDSPELETPPTGDETVGVEPTEPDDTIDSEQPSDLDQQVPDDQPVDIDINPPEQEVEPTDTAPEVSDEEPTLAEPTDDEETVDVEPSEPDDTIDTAQPDELETDTAEEPPTFDDTESQPEVTDVAPELTQPEDGEETSDIELPDVEDLPDTPSDDEVQQDIEDILPGDQELSPPDTDIAPVDIDITPPKQEVEPTDTAPEVMDTGPELVQPEIDDVELTPDLTEPEDTEVDSAVPIQVTAPEIETEPAVTDTETDTEQDTDTDVEPEVTPTQDTDTATQTDLETDTQTDTETDTETDTQTDTETDTEQDVRNRDSEFDPFTDPIDTTATTTVAPTIATNIDTRVNTDPQANVQTTTQQDTTRTPRPGAAIPPRQVDPKAFAFKPINIKDPLELRRYQGWNARMTQ